MDKMTEKFDSQIHNEVFIETMRVILKWSQFMEPNSAIDKGSINRDMVLYNEGARSVYLRLRKAMSPEMKQRIEREV